MTYYGQKEELSGSIAVDSDTKAFVFVESYSVAPTIRIKSTNGDVNAASNITTIGCDVVATDTDGRSIVICVIE